MCEMTAKLAIFVDIPKNYIEKMLGINNKCSENHREVQETTGLLGLIPYLCDVIINPFYKHLKKQTIMNKTVRILLEIIAAICAGLLGGAGAQALM